VLVGGEIKSHCGLNLPGSTLSIPSLTEKDIVDLEFGLKNKVDFFAMSFVRSADDIDELRKILNERWTSGQSQEVSEGRAQSEGNIGTGTPLIVAKLETPQAMQNLDAIIAASDWLMVARGDLAIETDFQKVPIEQKIITEKCNAAGKPTIVATQMMESMVSSTTPTRAEANDVANAVLDGAEAVMLSEETALGSDPALVVRDMALVIEETERDAGLVRNEMAS
jgi:pyruvate kinase